ncbi:hypothetical protein CU100_26230 [Phyllobacterium endophyticum]|uniref:Uncharacterized protein n=1 Tax=Phyllobacterium endophyticum TaxID=1149773 RepID=A0A2P7AKC7_9HYPH|nr:hypothetical protein CU100_26230 [Phyllobacterium endophyticum]
MLSGIVALAKESLARVVVKHEMAFAKTVTDRDIVTVRGEILEAEQFFTTPATERPRLFLSQILTH